MVRLCWHLGVRHTIDEAAELTEHVVAEVGLGASGVIEESRWASNDRNATEETNALGRLERLLGGDRRRTSRLGEGNVRVEIHRHRDT